MKEQNELLIKNRKVFIMGQIYFTEGLFDKVLHIIEESHDCLDVANDLKTIKNTICNGSESEAKELDDYLRKKYPIIDNMLNIADSIPAHPASGNSNTTSQFTYKEMLVQDRCGILCQIAIDKGLKQDLKSCIDHVEL